MVDYWVVFATTGSGHPSLGSKHIEGDFLALLPYGPKGSSIEDRIYAWYGPVNLNAAEVELWEGRTRPHTPTPHRADKAELASHEPAYTAKAFDSAQTVTAAEIPVIPKGVLLAAILAP